MARQREAQTVARGQKHSRGLGAAPERRSHSYVRLLPPSRVQPAERRPSRQGRPSRAQGLNLRWRCSTKFSCCLRKPRPWYLAAKKMLLLHMQFHTSLHRSCDSPARAVLCRRRNACASAEKFNWIFSVDYRLRISSYILEKLSYLLPSRANAAA